MSDDEGRFDYTDIIELERPDFGNRPHMGLEMRAAQFAPFAALSGYAEAIDETTRRFAESGKERGLDG